MNTLFDFLYNNDTIDRALGALYSGKSSGTRKESTDTPRAYKVQGDDRVTLYVELPGCKKDDIQLTIGQNSVKLSAVRTIGDYSGMYEYTYTFTGKYDVSGSDASYENGMLEITVPVATAKEGTLKIR